MSGADDLLAIAQLRRRSAELAAAVQLLREISLEDLEGGISILQALPRTPELELELGRLWQRQARIRALLAGIDAA